MSRDSFEKFLKCICLLKAKYGDYLTIKQMKEECQRYNPVQNLRKLIEKYNGKARIDNCVVEILVDPSGRNEFTKSNVVFGYWILIEDSKIEIPNLWKLKSQDCNRKNSLTQKGRNELENYTCIIRIASELSKLYEDIWYSS